MSTQTRQHLLDIPVSVLNASHTQTEDATKLFKDFSSTKVSSVHL